LWPNFPVRSHALVLDPAGGERQVTAQTRNFSRGLYKELLNEKNRPYTDIPYLPILPKGRGPRPFKISFFGSSHESVHGETIE
jgi:hypothetical protein